MMKLYMAFSNFCATLIAPLANLVARIYVGMEFFTSGRLKLDDFEGTIELFEEDWLMPIGSPEMNAYLATAGELVLPILLFLGLFTRFAASGLFVMALVIELFVFPDTAQHYYWMVIFGLLIGYGGDKISLDNFLFRNKR